VRKSGQESLPLEKETRLREVQSLAYVCTADWDLNPGPYHPRAWAVSRQGPHGVSMNTYPRALVLYLSATRCWEEIMFSASPLQRTLAKRLLE